MVLTRAQRQQSKDEPGPPKTNALKEPARRGKKKAATEPAPEEAKPEAKPKAARVAATKKPAKAAAPAARKTRAKEPEPVEESVPEPPQEETAQEPEPQVEPVTKKAPVSRKRPAKDPEPAPPAKRAARGRAAVKQPAEEIPVMEEKKTTEEPAPRATRATRGTKASEKRAAATAPAVKPLAQRIKVAAKKPAKKGRKQVEEDHPVEETNHVDAPAPEEAADTQTKPADPVPEPEAAAEEPIATSDEHESDEKQEAPATTELKSDAHEVETEAPEPETVTVESKTEVQEVEEAPAPVVDSQEPEMTAQEPELEASEQIKETEVQEVVEAEPKAAEAAVSEDKMDVDEQAPATPTKSPRHNSKIPVRSQTNTPASSNGKSPSLVSPYRNSYAKQTTPPTAISVATLSQLEKSAHTTAAPTTPGQQAATATSTKMQTPFEASALKPTVSALKTSSMFSLPKPSAMKSLLHETPRRNPMASPLKFPALSAAKTSVEEKSESMLQSPPKKAPYVASTIGQTPLRAAAANSDHASASLHTPARKGLMLPPSTAPVNKNGPATAFSTSTLLQTCPRKIALPEQPFKSCMSTSKAHVNEMGSSLLKATPKRVHIDLPSKEAPTPGTSVVDFASHAKTSLIGGTPRRPKTPASTRRLFATPSGTASKKEVSEGGSPILSRATPAGLKDVSSALDMLKEEAEGMSSPLDRPSTPTEQIMLGVIDELDQDMPDEPAEETALRAAIEKAVVSGGSSKQDAQTPTEEVEEHPSLFEEDDPMGEFVMTEDTPMEEKKNPFETKIELARPDARPDTSGFDEPSIASIDEPTLQLQNEIEFATPRANRVLNFAPDERKDEETAKKQKRSRSARLSLAIGLESSIKKPRQSIAFIPSMSPTKSALKSPMKNPFGSPKKSVTWVEPEEPKEEDFNITIPCPDGKLLTGASVFVDVRTANGDDAGDLFIPLLEEMGATIVSNWSNNNLAVSHVLFKDGEIRTLEKVVASKGAVKAVNIAWVLDCERFNTWVPEKAYLIDLSLVPGQSPHKSLLPLSLNATPLPRTPNRASPIKNLSPIKGTPFALNLSPRLHSSDTPNSNGKASARSPSAASDIEDKENIGVSPAPTYMDSPTTPYFLHPKDLVQKTCPPKQTQRGLFEREVGTPRTDGFKARLLMARRSLSPVKLSKPVW